MSIELVPLGTATIQLADPIFLPDTPKGTRIIIELTSLAFEGDRIRAKMKGAAGADWVLLSADGTASLDVRYAMETDDGAVIYVTYHGRGDFSGGPGSAPVYSAPVFETGDARYAWMNKIQALAKGTVDGSTLTYEIYEVR